MTHRYERSKQLVVSHIGLDVFSAHLLLQAVLRIRLEDLVKLHIWYIRWSVIRTMCQLRQHTHVQKHLGQVQFTVRHDVQAFNTV